MSENQKIRLDDAEFVQSGQQRIAKISFDLQMAGGFLDPSVETLTDVVNSVPEFQALEGLMAGYEDTIKALSEDADMDTDERLDIKRSEQLRERDEAQVRPPLCYPLPAAPLS